MTQQNKLLSKNAQNPYAAYSSNCSTCRTKCDPGRKYCHKCAFKANACAMCGKSLVKKDKAIGDAAGGARGVTVGESGVKKGKQEVISGPVVTGQRFSAK
jgi:Microtubule-associated protein CRIPT